MTCNSPNCTRLAESVITTPDGVAIWQCAEHASVWRVTRGLSPAPDSKRSSGLRLTGAKTSGPTRSAAR